MPRLIRALFVGGPLDGQVYEGEAYSCIQPEPIVSVSQPPAGSALPSPGSFRIDRTTYHRDHLAIIDCSPKLVATFYVAPAEFPASDWDRKRLDLEWARAELAGCVEELP